MRERERDREREREIERERESDERKIEMGLECGNIVYGRNGDDTSFISMIYEYFRIEDIHFFVFVSFKDERYHKVCKGFLVIMSLLRLTYILTSGFKN